MTNPEFRSKMLQHAKDCEQYAHDFRKSYRVRAAISLGFTIAIALGAIAIGNPFSMIGVPLLLVNARSSVKHAERAWNRFMELRQEALNDLHRYEKLLAE